MSLVTSAGGQGPFVRNVWRKRLGSRFGELSSPTSAVSSFELIWNLVSDADSYGAGVAVVNDG